KMDRVQVDLPVAEFYPAVRQAALMTTENQPGIYLNFKPGKLEISASGAEGGNTQIDFPVSYDREEIRIKLDPNFLVDFLRCFPGAANLSVYLKEDSSVLFETQQDNDYSYILMPLA
ncbi:MAG: hypothetical protein K6E55_02605, partial [Thermoguttaceae bacterium]|nr:hypothetical protein [Thermoguttaceae bacterium]